MRVPEHAAVQRLQVVLRQVDAAQLAERLEQTPRQTAQSTAAHLAIIRNTVVHLASKD